MELQAVQAELRLEKKCLPWHRCPAKRAQAEASAKIYNELPESDPVFEAVSLPVLSSLSFLAFLPFLPPFLASGLSYPS